MRRPAPPRTRLVMVPVITVRMAMCNLVSGSATHILDHTFEKQPFTRERMVAIDNDLVFGDIGDGINHPSIIVFALRQALELHAHLDIGRKYTFGLNANQVFVVIAKCIGWIERYFKQVASRFSSEPPYWSVRKFECGDIN